VGNIVIRPTYGDSVMQTLRNPENNPETFCSLADHVTDLPLEERSNSIKILLRAMDCACAHIEGGYRIMLKQIEPFATDG
jgi:hypothetical protein